VSLHGRYQDAAEKSLPKLADKEFVPGFYPKQESISDKLKKYDQKSLSQRMQEFLAK